jgi:hypothetical protein
MSLPSRQEETADFSLMLGGPLYQMLQRAHLMGPTLKLQKRRVLLMIAITWLPLLLLSAITGHLFGGQGLPFLETHVRFLIALPVLLIAELVVRRFDVVSPKRYVSLLVLNSIRRASKPAYRVCPIDWLA